MREEEGKRTGQEEAVHAQVQDSETGFPTIPSSVEMTERGTRYLRAPGVALLARPSVHVGSLQDFLEGFDPEMRFPQYLDDPTPLTPGVQVCKTAGQLCYMSFGPRRTANAAAGRYFRNIIESGHGSVLEHANFTFLFYGISRSLSHELVRHRAGMGFSQVSQRYVSGRALRFVERPEYQHDPELHAAFLRRIDAAAEEYERLAERLVEKQKAGDELLSADARTDLRKKVQQAARSVLPNETEAPIVVTGNARAWRHVIAMRANPHAEIEIRELAVRAFLCLSATEPILFEDYRLVPLPDGTFGVETDYPKV